jgi:creatinine amidohydrolase
MCAIGIAEDVAQRTGAIVTPPLWFGWSPHHMAYPGTISLRPEVVADVLVDVGKSLNVHGFRKQVWICGHRVANLPPMQIAAWKVREETSGQAHVVVVDPWYMSKTARESLGIFDIGHADEHETSMMLYKFPKLVQMNRAVKDLRETRKFSREDDDHTTFVPGIPADLKRRTARSGGALGDATLATREKGRKLHTALVNNIVEIVQGLKKTAS